MKRVRVICLMFIAIFALMANDVYSGGPGSGRRSYSTRRTSSSTYIPKYKKGRAISRSKSSSGTVNVKGYYRKDGTYVQPHTRSSNPASKGSQTDNSSTSQQNVSASQGAKADSQKIIGIVNEAKGKSGRVTSYSLQNDQGDYTILKLKKDIVAKQLGKKIEVTGKVFNRNKGKKVVYVKDWKTLD